MGIKSGCCHRSHSFLEAVNDNDNPHPPPNRKGLTEEDTVNGVTTIPIVIKANGMLLVVGIAIVWYRAISMLRRTRVWLEAKNGPCIQLHHACYPRYDNGDREAARAVPSYT